MPKLSIPVTSADHADGPANAPITLVEYGDYQCPSCGEAHPIIARIKSHFDSRLRFVFRNFPLFDIHPEAENAAEVAEFASTQDRFWQMHDALYENQRLLGGELYGALGGRLNLSVPDMTLALQARSFHGRIRADFSGGVRSGVNGTPTFYINDKRHDAAFDFKTLSAALESA